MIRPELRDALFRWREALAGAGLLALGLYWAFLTGPGLLHWIGYAVALGGAALCVAGVQRGRFRQGGGGPGIVQVVEGRISYFGPLDGGIADLADLASLSIDPTGRPPVWVLERPREPALRIPVNAEGADQLFDAFAALPGIRTERMLAQMQGGAVAPVVIWRASPVQPGRARLH